MRQASDELKQMIETGNARLYQKAHVTFAGGSQINLDQNDFYLSGNGFSDGAGTNALALGEAMAKTINALLVNDKDRLSDYDFNGAKITLWCCCDLSSGTERIKIGEFTINTTAAKEGAIEVTGTDDMYKGDTDYDTSLSFPATAKQILIDSCRKCGVALKKESFTNDSFTVLKKPTQCTHRAVWGMIAMLAGGNARMDADNLLEIISYDLSFFARQGLDGGAFDKGEPSYKTGDTADGGNFTDYSSGDTYDGGGFEELGRYHMFYKSQAPTIETDDVVITGVQAESGDSSGFYGTEGYILSVDNQLISGRVQEGVDAIGRLVTGMRFRPFTVDHTAYPFAEFGDICYVFDRKGNHYQSVVTDVNFSFYGYTTIKCSADSAMRNQSEFKPEAAGIIAEVEKQTDEKFGEVEQDIGDINDEIGDIHDNIGNLEISLKRTDDGLLAEVSRALSAEEKIGSRIEMTEKSIELEVARSKWEEEKLYSRISMTESSISAEVSRASAAEGTLSSRINMAADNISAEVTRATNAEGSLSSRINMNANSIVAEVNRASAAEGNLSSSITITDNKISSKVSKGDVSSEISQEAGRVSISGNRVSISSSYFSLSEMGVINAKSGTIGAFTITSYGSLRGQKISIEGNQLQCNEIVPYTGVQVSIGSDVYVYSQLRADGNVYFGGVYNNSTTADPNLHITSTGYLNTKGGSSRRWKHNIGNIRSPEIDPHRLYNVRPRQFIYNDDYISPNDSRAGKMIPGFIIEELLEDYPIAVDYDESGNPETWSPSMFTAPTIKLLQEHKKEINKLKAGMQMLLFLYGQSARSNLLC